MSEIPRSCEASDTSDHSSASPACSQRIPSQDTQEFPRIPQALTTAFGAFPALKRWRENPKTTPAPPVPAHPCSVLSSSSQHRYFQNLSWNSTKPTGITHSSCLCTGHPKIPSQGSFGNVSIPWGAVPVPHHPLGEELFPKIHP